MPYVLHWPTLKQAMRKWSAKHDTDINIAELSRRTGVGYMFFHNHKKGVTKNISLERLDIVARFLEIPGISLIANIVEPDELELYVDWEFKEELSDSSIIIYRPEENDISKTIVPNSLAKEWKQLKENS